MAPRYRPGGYHPIHIGDTFKAGRYTIAHMLGSGAYSTVWLAEDSETETYVALKVLAADASKWSGNAESVNEELRVLLRLREGADEISKDNVVQVIDHFLHTGPNGKHQCIVTELLGPDVGLDIDILPWSVGRAIIRQVTYAIRYLHRNNTVHGDLHPGNVLFASQVLSSLSNDDIVQYYGEVEKENWVPTDTHDQPPHAPLYLVEPSDASSLIQACLDDPTGVRVKICDFSESSIITENAKPKLANMPLIHRAPEVLIKREYTPEFSADIWALAVLFYQIATGGEFLFLGDNRYRPPSAGEILQQIVLRVGKLPEKLWSAWPERAQYFNEDGKGLDGRPDTLAGTRPLFPRFSCHVIDDFEERVLFEQMLKNMLTLEPEGRPSIDSVIESDWFVKYCTDTTVH